MNQRPRRPRVLVSLREGQFSFALCVCRDAGCPGKVTAVLDSGNWVTGVAGGG
jgi:hypothetical protein